MAISIVTVYCDREDCIYNQQNKCSTTGIQINSDGFCETYEKEELNPLDNPDHERDIKED